QIDARARGEMSIVGRVEPDRLGDVRESAGVLLAGEIVLGPLGEIDVVCRHQPDRLVVVGQGKIYVAPQAVGAAAMIVEVGLGLQLDGLGVVGDGAVVVVLLEVGQAAMMVGVGIVGQDL